MSDLIEQSQLRASLVNFMIDLANEIDGVVDFGVTVCFLDEEKMAGRHSYIIQRCDRIRSIVKSIGSSIKNLAVPNLEQLSILQSELVADSHLLLNAYASLEAFRRLETESVRSATSTIQLEWEAIHKLIREMAEAAGVFDQSWYNPILERQNSYRDNVRQLFVWFQEAAAVSSGSTNELPE